jgi:hypothetical protein
MGAGQSVHTILKCAEWRGIPVRDLYPIARSSVESFINAAFLLVEDETAAERAVRWVAFRAWRQAHRAGRYTLRNGDADKSVPSEFSEFRAFKDSDWTSEKVPDRAKWVAEVVGKRAGYRLLAAYDLIYPLSSEVIHGSPFGVNFFYQAHMPPPPTIEDFRQATGIQIEDILIAVSHAAAGYLAAFFRSMQMSAPYVTEQELFNRLLALEGVEPQEVQYLT